MLRPNYEVDVVTEDRVMAHFNVNIICLDDLDLLGYVTRTT